MVHNAIRNDNSVDLEETLVTNGSESVKRKSMITLRPKTWLNDEIISYYLKVALTTRDDFFCKQDSNRKRNYFYNSYFMQNLLDEYNDIDPNCRGIYNYAKVSTWGRKCPGGDIFKLKHIFVPINIEHVHWALAVIYMEEKKICWYDSLHNTDEVRLKALLQYLKDEHRNIHKEELEDKNEWTLILGCFANCPQQENSESNITIDHITTFS